MSRLWRIVIAAGVAAFIAMSYGLGGRSLWPSVALFCLAGLLACVAACIDAGEASSRNQDALDKTEAATVDDFRLSALEAKVEHMQKIGALNSAAGQ